MPSLPHRGPCICHYEFVLVASIALCDEAAFAAALVVRAVTSRDLPGGFVMRLLLCSVSAQDAPLSNTHAHGQAHHASIMDEIFR